MYSAYLPALEAAWRVGDAVVERLVANWQQYRDTTPAGKP
jgi:purine nucleoside permease